MPANAMSHGSHVGTPLPPCQRRGRPFGDCEEWGRHLTVLGHTVTTGLVKMVRFKSLPHVGATG